MFPQILAGVMKENKGDSCTRSEKLFMGGEVQKKVFKGKRNAVNR